MFGLPVRCQALLARFQKARDGGIAPIFAMSAVAIVLSVGLGVEYSRSLATQADMQAALDSAALAAVAMPSAQRAAFGTSVFQASFPSGSVSWTNNANGSLTGTASVALPTTLMGVAGVNSIQLAARSTASAAAAPGGKVCFLVLDPTSPQALLVNSGVTLSAPNCEIDVASTASPAAMFNASSTFNVSRICVAGSNVTQNGGPVSVLKTGCTVASDPFSGTLPTAATSPCSVNGGNVTGYNTLVPGIYCGTFNLNGTGTLNLQPGLYVLSNAHLNVNSGWTIQGTGVTFYFADQNSYIQINSGAALKISAPTSGTYADILIYEPPGLAKTGFSIDGGAGHTFSGLIYLPSRNITFNSMSSVSAENLTMVVNQLILNPMNWTFANSTTKTITASGGGSSSPILIK
jgi:Flp pilus assembly protein TadG